MTGWLLALAVGCGDGTWLHHAAAAVDDAAAHNPLSTIERTPDEPAVTGVVAERRAAGGYTYYRVHTGAGDRWVVSVGAARHEGDVVRVRSIGLARDFTSTRTGHTYDELWFAVVSANDSP